MDWSQITVAVIFTATVISLALSLSRPTHIFTLCLISLFVAGIVTPGQALQNAVNPGVATLIALLLASKALERTSILKTVARHALSGSEGKSILKLSSMAALFSSFLNNTAIVAALITPIKAQTRIPASKLLMPLSYASILGGTTTIIGTSTNMVINSFWMAEGHDSLSFFAFFPVGIILVLFGLVLIYLRRNTLPITQLEHNQSHYFVDLKLKEDSALIGKTVESAGLRSLNSFFLVELIRNKRSITPVSSSTVLEPYDRLVFSGDVNRLDELQEIAGAKIFAEHTGLLSENLAEVVIAERSSLVGATLKSSGFRAMFDAAVVGLKRNGLSIPGKLGEVVLKEGDSLLLAAGSDFKQRKNLSKHFFIISDVSVEKPLTKTQNWGVIGGFITVLAANIAGFSSLFDGLCIFTALCVFGRVIKANELKQMFPFDLWIIITAALTLAMAMTQSGLSDLIANNMHAMFSEQSAWFAMVGLLLLTILFTEVVTNTAAAALMFPLAISLSHSFGINELPFVMAVAFGASACFLSPYGYQTNLIVFNTAGYKFTDFVKFGFPITTAYIIICVAVIPYFYPF